MTGKIWFTGDPHFNHPKVAKIRGFETTAAHDFTIMKTWEEQVEEDHTVYVTGDISGGKEADELYALALLATLPGKKRLISGNHDSVSGIHREKSKNEDVYREVFESISDYGRVRMNGHQVLLSHYPYWSQKDGPGRGEGRYEQYRLPDLGGALIHAHTHHNDPYSGSLTARELCVSWDAWNRLVNIDEVSLWMNTIEWLLPGLEKERNIG